MKSVMKLVLLTICLAPVCQAQAATVSSRKTIGILAGMAATAGALVWGMHKLKKSAVKRPVGLEDTEGNNRHSKNCYYPTSTWKNAEVHQGPCTEVCKQITDKQNHGLAYEHHCERYDEVNIRGFFVGIGFCLSLAAAIIWARSQSDNKTHLMHGLTGTKDYMDFRRVVQNG